MRAFVAAISGVLFALGLGLSGMTDPRNVAAFLDVFGAWSPALAFVMGGALAVYASAFRFAKKRGEPILDGKLHLPSERRITGRLVAGALLFGVGWGLSGYCPGPAIVSIGAFSLSTAGLLAFTAAMVSSAWIVRAVERSLARRSERRRSEAQEVGLRTRERAGAHV
ncbi:MAG: hypothetical protein IT381_24640 [Deltaproteobacteria bacterium]|nr:hypothetical protein [Deltaproteobacteria bacterium]